MAKHGGFGGGMPGMNMNNLMKQYQKMQKKLEETQEELAKKDAVDPEDVETLEEMIVLAMNQALSDIEKESNQEMGKLTGGMGLGF